MEKYKNTKWIFGSNGKYPKKKQCIFVFYLVFCENTKKTQKKNKNKYECNFSKIQNSKEKTNQKFRTYKMQKKIRTQNFKNTKYKENTNSKISQSANPMFTLEIRKQIAKKIQIQPVAFSKPCNSDFVFLNCIFSYFLGIFKYGQKTRL